jgi:dihydroneopterin aldolase
MDLVVVKIGGSLAKDRQWAAWLDVLAGRGGPLIVVPGGGAFADCVRAQQRVMGFSDKAAHRMALSAMGQFGMALAAQSPVFRLARSRGEIEKALGARRIPVWLPENMVLDAEDIPPSWDVTSDSLAAWLAGACRARRLLLIKSCEIAGPASAHDLAGGGMVDAEFPRFAARSGAKTWLAGPAALRTAAQTLQSGRMPGTLLLEPEAHESGAWP